MLTHYSPYRSLSHNNSSTDESRLDIERLANIELHLNKYKIISYGCSINVSDDQSLGTERLLHYGFPCEGISTLYERGWDKMEPPDILQDRIVAELSTRIGTYPEGVDIPTLSRKLKAEIPTEDTAFDRKAAYLHREGRKRKLEAQAQQQYAVTRSSVDPPSVQEISSLPIFESSLSREPRRVQQIEETRSSKSILEQTIQWSTSSEVFFVPLAVEGPPPRRIVVSPLELSESEYLDDIPTSSSAESLSSQSKKVNEEKDMESIMEQQKRIMRTLRASGEDRI